MHLQQRINAFVSLGHFLGQFGGSDVQKKESIPHNDAFFDIMNEQLLVAKAQNRWFTEENLQYTFKSWGDALSETNINTWLSNYEWQEKAPKTVGLVMAGNIPLVGFHDFLSVLISGNRVLAKLSSNDKALLPFIAKYLMTVEPGFKEFIAFTEEKLENFDAVIATGSDNTARYFEYYFGKYPNIIRKNRNSVALLSGSESAAHLELLANDIFQYFGLGCRNVSKIYIPRDYNFDSFFKAMYSWNHIINDNKYINNYDYNKAVYLMSNINLLDNEFMLLKEDPGMSSPISVLFYEYYDDLTDVKEQILNKRDQIQCIVSQLGIENEVSFGKTQSPMLWEYADDKDTLQFLQNL